MMYRILLLSVLSWMPVTSVRAGDPLPVKPSRLHAAVFLVRGSVSGSNIGSYGPFVRLADSAWHRLSRSNVISFGFGSFTRGEPRRLYLAGGNGVHRSTDDGETWRILTGWETMEILSVLPHPVNPSLIYASTPWGVYRSRDEGLHWFPATKGFAELFVRHLAFDTRTSDVLYATAWDDLYTSTNSGDEWRPMGVGKGPVLAFLQHPGDPDLLLVACEDRGILYSTDGGQQWRRADCPSPSSIYAMAASSDGSFLYAAGWETGIWRSTDNGRNWTVLWTPKDIQTFFCLLVDPHDSRHIYAGTDGNGVYESVDAGQQWSRAGLNGGKIKQLFFYP